MTQNKAPDKKTEVPGLYLTSEGFLINKDNESLKAYKTQRLKAKESKDLKKDIITLKNDMEEIKNILKGLVK